MAIAMQRHSCKGTLRALQQRSLKGTPLKGAKGYKRRQVPSLLRPPCRPRLARVAWSYIVVDEGHRLKNSGCKLNAELKQYKAAHRLLLTGGYWCPRTMPVES